eukprot:EG_transcript_24904
MGTCHLGNQGKDLCETVVPLEIKRHSDKGSTGDGMQHTKNAQQLLGQISDESTSPGLLSAKWFSPLTTWNRHSLKFRRLVQLRLLANTNTSLSSGLDSALGEGVNYKWDRGWHMQALPPGEKQLDCSAVQNRRQLRKIFCHVLSQRYPLLLRCPIVCGQFTSEPHFSKLHNNSSCHCCTSLPSLSGTR